MGSPGAADELAQLYQEGLRLHQAGQLAGAENLYRRVLARKPGHVDSLHLLAVCRHEQRDFAEAEKLLQRALKARPDLGTLHLSFGNVQRERARLAAAIQSYERATRLAPSLAIAHYNLGTALEEAGRTEEARAAYERALAIAPQAGALSGRANCLFAAGRTAEAVADYQRSLALDPAQPAVLANLSAALRQLGLHADADRVQQSALQLGQARSADPAQRALSLNDLGRGAEALQEIDAALAAGAPPSASLLHQRARALWLLDRFDAALGQLEQAQALAPQDWTIRFDLAAALVWRADRMPEAFAHLDRLEQERPAELDVAYNRAKGQHTIGALEDARASLAALVPALQAQGRPAHLAEFALALIDLLQGRFEAGWRGYERRWEDPVNRVRKRAFAQPLWLGDEAIAGERLLVHAEQGLGDTLQFARYLPALRARGAQIAFEVPAPLLSLLRRALPADVALVPYGTPLMPFDRHVPLMSLPLALRTNLQSIPPPLAGLAAEPARVLAWRNRLGTPGVRRIGLAWSGNPGHRRDHERSLPLARLEPLLGALRERLGSRVEFVALQNHLRRADEEAWARTAGLHCYGEALADFEDTAALTSLCDLVISVDTASAHLAGALGKPTWLLLQFVPDWRWLLEREDSPWYPSLRLFRQQALGDWDGVLERVQAEALAWAGTAGADA